VLQRAVTEGIGGVVLDLGCGTGHLSGLLSSNTKIERVIALDIAWTMLETARGKFSLNPALHYVCADAEKLPFATHSLDGIYSNLAVQWCHPLHNVLVDFKRMLKPGSPLVFSTFGPETLKELKNAWTHADNLPHVNVFHSDHEIFNFLHLAGFNDICIDRRRQISRYASVFELMRELKNIGAHNTHLERQKNLMGKNRMQAMCAAYEDHRSNGLIPATFEILLVTARA
jgi:malonyl-CoA O-methyltransferase